MRFRHTDFDDSVNVTRENPLYTLAKYASACLGLVLALYIASALAVDIIAERMDYDTEIWIGDRLAQTPPADVPPEKQRYVETLFAAIPKEGLPPLPYRVQVVEDATPNAGALPGGLIRVHSGLLEAVPSENGLTFVLGHELGHYANRDHLKGLGRGLVVSALSILFLGEGRATANLLGHAIDLSGLEFSRKQETQADLWGLKLLAARYGHAGGAADFFSAVEGRDTPRWAELLSTHPASSARINAVHDAVKRLGYPERETIPQPYYRP